MVVSVTNEAIKAIKKQLEDNNKSFLRIGIQGSGCNGFSYFVDFQPAIGPNDQTFVFSDIAIVIDQKSMKYLKGTEIDWENSLLRQGFLFRNPNAKTTCGCGLSFDVEGYLE